MPVFLPVRDGSSDCRNNGRFHIRSRRIYGKRSAFQYAFSAIGAQLAFRRLCFARCGSSCSSVFGRALPHPDPGGYRPHTPAYFGIRGHNMTYSFQRRLPALSCYFAFRRLCFAGCGNSCSSVFGRAFPHPEFGGCRPHTPAYFGIRGLNMTYPFQRRLPALSCHFAFRSPCFAGCGNGCLSVYRRAFPHPDPGGCRPYTPAYFGIRGFNMTYSLYRTGVGIRGMNLSV